MINCDYHGWNSQDNEQCPYCEIEDLRALLARCTMYLQRVDTARLQTIGSKVALSSILEDLPRQAKADAEVLRCAEKLYQEYFYGNDDEKAMRHNRVLVRGIHNAVSASKEKRDE